MEAIGMDDENYLMPRMTTSKEDEPGLVYTPVLATDQDGKFFSKNPNTFMRFNSWIHEMSRHSATRQSDTRVL